MDPRLAMCFVRAASTGCNCHQAEAACLAQEGRDFAGGHHRQQKDPKGTRPWYLPS